MKESNTLITTQDGTSLYVISLAPNNKNLENSKTLLLIHGYHEYGGRYREVAKTFVKAGYRVVIPDMRGHGHSSGARGHVMQWSDYHDDLDAIIKFIDVPKEKLALLGHSNGGLLAATFILDRPKRVGVAALSSPLMGLSMVPPKWKILLGKGISRCLPLVSLPTEVQPEWTCKTPSVVKNFQEDPLNHHSVNTRWFTESLFAIEHAMQWAHTLSIPLKQFKNLQMLAAIEQFIAKLREPITNYFLILKGKNAL